MRKSFKRLMVGMLATVMVLTAVGAVAVLKVTADSGVNNLSADGEQDVTLKTDGSDQSYYVVAIPQEIVMVKNEGSVNEYSANYSVKAKGIIASGSKLYVHPTDGEDVSGKYVKDAVLTDASSSKNITATMTQNGTFFYPNGETSGSGQELSPSEYMSLSGNSVTTVEVPGSYEGTVGFTVKLVSANSI